MESQQQMFRVRPAAATDLCPQAGRMLYAGRLCLPLRETEPDRTARDGPGPGGRVIGIASRGHPQDRARFCGHLG